ncbi:MAG: ribonuclease P protein component [Bacteroidota bacterium]
MPKPIYSFKKRERLTSRKSIARLFESGRRINSFPLRILYDLTHDEEFPSVMAVSVPKRLFKRAVDRNLLKRRIREVYRYRKPDLYALLNKEGVQIRMVIQYRDRKITDFHTIEKGFERAISKITEQL